MTLGQQGSDHSAEHGREIAAIATRDPARTAIHWAGGAVTFGDFERDVDALASAMAGAGLEVGDTVAVVCTNRPEWLVVLQASLRAGVRLVPVNWHLESDDVAYVLDDSGARGVFVESTLAHLLRRSRPAHWTVSIGGVVDGTVEWRSALEAGRARGPSPVRPRGTQMIYTSGTTGRPKGVRHHPTPTSQAAAIGAAMVSMFGMDGDAGDSILCPAPLYHSGPIRLCGEWPLGAGVGVVLMDRFDPRATLELIERHRITHAFFVPTMFQRLLKVGDRTSFDVSSLRFVVHGAGPCARETKEAMLDWFGPVIHEIYAASEGPGTWITPEEWLAHPGSVGRADPTLIAVRRENGTPADPGEEGTVWSRSTSGFSYHGDDDKTAMTYDSSGEWFSVGDRGHLDEDGYLYLTGRTSECIISGGVNLYPRRVDDALATAPGIVDGAAFGIPDDELGEVLVAAVVPADQDPDERRLQNDVIAHCRSLVGSQLTPHHVFIVDQIPRSDAGKLYRRRLTERFSSPR